MTPANDNRPPAYHGLPFWLKVLAICTASLAMGYLMERATFPQLDELEVE